MDSDHYNCICYDILPAMMGGVSCFCNEIAMLSGGIAVVLHKEEENDKYRNGVR